MVVFLLAGNLMLSTFRLSADELIPSSLSREKQERVQEFLDQVKQEPKRGLLPPHARVTAWTPQVTVELAGSNDDVVKEYLSAVVTHRAPIAARGRTRRTFIGIVPTQERARRG